MHEMRSQLRNGRTVLASKAKTASGAHSLAAVGIRREETRRSNQRREDRHLNLANRAEIVFRRRRHDVTVINVSSNGAMIETPLEARIGEKLQIRFDECNRTACVVRWVRDGRIGMEFEERTAIIASPAVRELIVSGRRDGERQQLELKPMRAPRHHLYLRGELYWTSYSMGVMVRNISVDGAMLAGSQDVPRGMRVVLQIEGDAIQGAVRWCESGQIGVRFDEPYDLERLARPEPTIANDTDAHPTSYVKPEYLGSDGQANSPWSARFDRLNPDDL